MSDNNRCSAYLADYVRNVQLLRECAMKLDKISGETWTHDVLYLMADLCRISTEVVNLEELYEFTECGYVWLENGYRCPDCEEIMKLSSGIVGSDDKSVNKYVLSGRK